MLDPNLLLPLSGAVIGVAFGATGWWSGFCVRGAIEDVAGGRSTSPRFAGYVVALAIAVIGVQGLVLLGLLNAADTAHLPLVLGFGGSIVGGFLFGIGMVLAGGCGARLLVLGGGGNLRSISVLLIFALVAYATMRGILGPLRTLIAGSASVVLAPPQSEASLARLLGSAISADPSFFRYAAMAFAVLAVIVTVRRAPSLRGILGGALIGTLIAASFALTGNLLADDLEPKPAEGLSVTRGLGDALVYLLTWTGSSLAFATAWIFGVPVGAGLVALARGEARLEGFVSPRQMLRYAGGGALMGLGGVLAAGCTIGHGLTGLSLLGPASLVAFAAIVAGAFATFRWQHRRSVVPSTPSPLPVISARH